MSLRNQILLLAVMYLSLKSYIFFLRRFMLKLKDTNDINKITFGLVSRKDLCNIPSSTFIEWSINLLQKLDFKNIHILSTSCDDDVQLLAYKNLKRVYIRCIICAQLNSDDEDNFAKIGKPELQKFAGTLEHDNIKYGYIITNGDFSADAEEYAATFPPETITLKLIDGCKLTRFHRQFQKQYIPSDLKVEVE